MDINKYEAFIKTVELGSLTKAGHLLGYTQSGISHILNSVEAEFGVKLLVRDRSGVYLSSAGKELYPYIQVICESNKRLQEKVNELHGMESGLIRVGTINSISTHWLPKLIRTFGQAHPNIAFQLRTGEYSEIESWIQREEIDMGFVKEPVQTNLEVYSLKRDPMVAVLPKGHPLAERETIPHKLLKDYPYILYIDGIDSEIQDIREAQDIASDAPYTAKDDYAIMAMVESGLGISVLPGLVLKRCPYEIEIRELDPPAYRDLAIAVKEERLLAPAAKRFLDYVVSSDLP